MLVAEGGRGALPAVFLGGSTETSSGEAGALALVLGVRGPVAAPSLRALVLWFPQRRR